MVVAVREAPLDALHGALQRLWTTAGRLELSLPSSRWRAEFATALAEIGSNIVRHAHPAAAPASTVCLRLRIYPDRLEAFFTDRGLAYLKASAALCSSVRHDIAQLDELAESGYGLAIARAALDQLQYRRTQSGANCWRLVKRSETRLQD